MIMKKAAAFVRRSMAALGSEARILARRAGITLRFHGDRAYTDGKTITVPVPGEPDETQMTLLRGYVYHEAAHCRYTDYALLKSADMTPEVGKMFNLLEDIRIERLQGAEYYGCLQAFTELNASLFDMSPHPLNALLACGMKLVAGQPLENAPDPNLAKTWFGDDVFEKIAAASGPSGASADILALARELVGRLEEARRKEVEQWQRQACLSSGGRPTSGKGGASEEGGKGGASEEGRKGEKSEEGRKGGASEEGMGEAEGREPTASDMLDALRDYKDPGVELAGRLADRHRQDLEAGVYMPWSRAEDRIEAAPAADTCEGYYRLRALLGKTNVLRRLVVDAFQCERNACWVGDRDNGRLNSRALYKVETGNFRIFKKLEPVPELSAAVGFLVDFSGSMSERDKIRNAMAAVVLFLECLEQAEIPCEVLGYGSCGGYEIPSGVDVSRYSSEEKLLTLVFKSYTERLDAVVRRRVAGYDRIGMRLNYDCESVGIAYERLMAREEERKILFVLSDGLVTCGPDEGASGRRELKRLVREIEREGRVELIAVDLMSGHAAEFYPRVIAVQNSGDLAADLLEGLKTHLFNRRAFRG